MIAAVTGGTGFVGQALVSRLLRSEAFSEVRVLTRRQASAEGTRTFRGDLCLGPLEPFLEGVDVLFHCAGELQREEAMHAVHVEGTRRLLAAAAGRVSRWVQLSSVGAYGRSMRAGIVDENSPLAPEGSYETTKVQADMLVHAAAASVTLRPSIIFGPGMPNRSLYQLVEAVKRGVFFFIGRGAIANYVYVDDVADALVACGTAANAAGVYNLSDDRPMEQFISIIARELGTGAPRFRVPEWLARIAATVLQSIPRFPLTEPRIDALTRRVRYPSIRIQTELGYRFRVSVEEGLRRLVSHWRDRQ
jgi:nucleoside-diphosphate-sugar epimerase